MGRNRKTKELLMGIAMVLLVLCSSKEAVNAAELEYAMFPMQCVNISQGEYGGYSHAGIRAIDNAGFDTGQDAFYAPFSGKVVRMYSDWGGPAHDVIIESLNPVMWADGTIDYVHMWLCHDNDVSDMYTGKVFSQGDVIYREGTHGNATGNHVHFVCGKGKYTGLTQASTGKWTVKNEVSAYNVLFLYENTSLYDGEGYNWKTLPGSNGNFSDVKPSEYHVNNTGVTDIKETTTRINATLSPSATVSELGFYLGTSPDNMQKHVEKFSGKVINIWYDLGTGKWTSALSKGTTYYYQIYVVIGGKTYYSAVDSFTTAGDGIAPTISNVRVTDITNTGYTVLCDVTDNVGVTRVCFPTWTDANGQDDISADWYNTTAVYQPSSGNTYAFRVNTSDHNGEIGQYTTHIYAYDAAGNYVSAGTAANIYFPLTNYSMNTSKLTIQKGTTQTLYITTYEPSHTTSDKTAYWSSANTSIAVVDANGNVTGKKSGTTYITCTVAGIVKQCEVVVTRNIPFSDVPFGSWYYDYVADVYEKGYMVGSGSTFKPNANLTRAEIVTTLYSVCGKPNTAFIGSFSDVKMGQWYSNPISWAYRNGIVSGYANGKFGVSDLITREQFAVMLYQYANTYNYNTAYNNNALAGYSDAGRVSSWASTAMKWAVSNGIISGKSNGILDPGGTATRAECATMIMKLTQL